VRIGLMTKEEVDSYFETWSSLENAKVSWDGDYFDIFKTSDAMITDCGSFLAEYLPTKKPILHLINKQSIGYNEVGNKIAKSLYRIENFNELVKVFESVVLKEEDDKFQDRIEALKVVPVNENGAGMAIYEHLKKKLGRN